MSKARPKKYFMLTISNFTGNAKVYIHCYPQQKWEYSIEDNKAHLFYKTMSLCIPKEDFEKYWKVVE